MSANRIAYEMLGYRHSCIMTIVTSQKVIADFRHRALRHHAEGIFMAETIFGATLKLSTGHVIPTPWIGEI
jgi:hypothetical protein